MEPLRPSSIVRFGTFDFSVQSGELRKAGIRIRVQQQPLKVLEVLLERPGEVVTREELRKRVWPDASFGDFDQAVNVAVAKLRSALGDAAENPRYIETLPKRGYRFIAEAAVVEAEGRARRQEPPVGDLTEPERPVSSSGLVAPGAVRRWPRRRIAMALGLVVALLAVALWLFHRRGTPAASIRSLAVLPLENLSGDASQDYFADGMTDQLITNLAQIGALRVISRTSVMAYKGTRKSLPQIAQELQVEAVVEGTVLRSGDQVRITAQLVQAPADKHLWAESYEGNLSDTLLLQQKVAQAIAERIRIELTPQERAGLRNVKPVNPEAYEDYLKGRYFWNKRTADGLQKAIDYFNQAIAIDPNYAAAYSGLSDSYALLGNWRYAAMTPKEALPKAKAAAQKALALDDSLSEAHASLALCLTSFDWDWQGADREFRRALELNPGYATAHHWYAWNLAVLGRNSEALAEMRKAQSMDPLSLIINTDLAGLLLIAHLPEESMQQSRRTIEMDPGFALAHNQLAQIYFEQHRLDDAISESQKAIELSSGNPTCIANLARAYAARGRTADATGLLNDLKKRSSHGYPYAAELAVIYAALGDKDQAFVWLDKAYEERFDPPLLIEPGFDPLRADPRFKELARRIGIPF